MVESKLFSIENQYLDDICQSIKQRPVYWERLIRANIVSEEDATRMKILEKQSTDEKISAVLSDLDLYSTTILNLLSVSNRPDILKYLLILILELITKVPNVQFLNNLLDLNKIDNNLPFDPFLKNLKNLSTFNNDKDSIQLLSVYNLSLIFLQYSTVIGNTDNQAKEKHFSFNNDSLISLFDHLNSLVQSSNSNYRTIAVQCISELLSIKSYRSVFWSKNSHYIPSLISLLTPYSKKKLFSSSLSNPTPQSNSQSQSPNLSSSDHSNQPQSNPSSASPTPSPTPSLSASNPSVSSSSTLIFRNDLQTQYKALLSLWLLSFNPSYAVDLVLNNKNLLKTLITISNDSIKEKIVRLSISILLNFINTTNDLNNNYTNKPLIAKKKKITKILLLNDSLPIITNLNQRKWSDEELIDDLNNLLEILNNSYQNLTTFDEYIIELDSMEFNWSPPHKNKEFWINYINNFKLNDWKLFKRLMNLFNSTLSNLIIYNNDSEKLKTLNKTLAVICNDISNVINLLPESMVILNNLGSKQKIMSLMNSSDINLRYEALKTTQVLVAHSFN
ncbi:H(+)-transporting V1 sector ATPase subunit H [Ascoidea rubescens DSM 1968]|uniref:ARM repeat-containing protein n=1 Tax=Ascoidea rubescens DSM 1968 TaxID=1344418 RepID=A0A1D2VIR1_9ASCO|nr:ARM repeat-containing protein [Ascoidea rubescens DSM 1968]ODV61526.1 ARM repeat-containing protein [Ascoidea rubescens DSM 1968]